MLILTALAALLILVIGWHAVRTAIRDIDDALASLRDHPDADEPSVPNPHRNTHD